MPRLPRVHLDKALYFVTSKGGYGQKLFNDPADYQAYLELLTRYQKEDGFKLFAFVLMPAYLHLLIEPTPEATISAIMHKLNSNYTKYYNARYNKRGHLFQGRFKNVIVEREGHLLELTRYIHVCPEKEGICDHAADYHYSSYGRYLGKSDALGPETNAEICETFSYIAEEDAVSGYQKYVAGITPASFEDLRKVVQRRPYLGSQAFIGEVKRKIEEAAAEPKNEVVYEEVVVRRTNPVFVAVGSVLILALSLVAFDLYKINLGWQTSYETTTSAYTQQVASMQKSIQEGKMLKEQLPEIERVAWEIQLMPVGDTPDNSHNDTLRFRKGQLVSEYLSASGYAPFNYTLVKKSDGTLVWQTSQVNKDGTKASWYGVYNGKIIRGVLSERPVAGRNRDFSFYSTKKING